MLLLPPCSRGAGRLLPGCPGEGPRPFSDRPAATTVRRLHSAHLCYVAGLWPLPSGTPHPVTDLQGQSKTPHRDREEEGNLRFQTHRDPPEPRSRSSVKFPDRRRTAGPRRPCCVLRLRNVTASVRGLPAVTQAQEGPPTSLRKGRAGARGQGPPPQGRGRRASLTGNAAPQPEGAPSLRPAMPTLPFRPAWRGALRLCPCFHLTESCYFFTLLS